MAATFIPESKVQEILNNVDIVDVISNYITLTKKGKSYKAICPFHDDHDPSLSVSREKQIYKCFVCGMGGNAINFVQEYNNISFQEAAKIVAKQAGIRLELMNASDVIPLHIKRTHALLKEVESYANYQLTLEDNKQALAYLEKERSLSVDMIKKFSIGYIPNSDYLHDFLIKKGYTEQEINNSGIFNQDKYCYLNGRITFPIHDRVGNTIAFSARTIKNEAAKYINSAECEVYQKGKHLYHLDQAQKTIRHSKEVILMEGQMNVIRAESFGITNCVAQLGTALSEDQIRLLKSLNVYVKLCYDGDWAGQQATLKNYQLLQKAGIKASLIMLPDKMDPDELLLKDEITFKSLISENPNILDYLLKQEIKTASFEQNEKYTMYFLRSLQHFEDPLAEDFYINKLSNKTGFSIDALKEKYQTMMDAANAKIKTKVHQKIPKNQKTTKWSANKKIGLHLEIKNKMKFKEEVTSKYDRLRKSNLVLAFDEHQILDRTDILKKYIDLKSPVLEARIALYEVSKNIDYAVQGISSAIAKELALELNIPKQNLEYIAYFQKHLEHPSLCIQFYQQEAFLDSYDLSSKLIHSIKQTVAEELSNIQNIESNNLPLEPTAMKL